MKKRRISLSTKFFLTSLISGAVIVTAAIAIAATLSFNAAVDQAEGDLDAISQSNVRLLSVYFQEKANQAQLYSGTRLVKDYVTSATPQNRALLATFLKGQLEAMHDLNDISFLDIGTGAVLIDGKGLPTVGQDAKSAAFWSHRFDTKPFNDPTLVRTPSKALVTYVTLPAADAVGAPVALLVLSIDWSAVSQKLLGPLKIGDTGYAVVYGPGGMLYYHPTPSKILDPQAITDTARQAWAKKNLFLRYFYNGDMKYMYAHEIPENGWVLNANVKETELLAPTIESVTWSLSLALVLLALASLVTYALARGISKPVLAFVSELSEASHQIGLSSGQLSQASQEIASGATEQASQIEETSASMEELASMVKQNVENAKQASQLASQSSESSKSGADEMQKVSQAMEEIGQSAEEIRGVIDVIEDISFQTNMLALNAAVEAARAGEAGLGFAVVADEVKNLANRSSASAKETADMIREANRKIAAGIEASQRLAGIFQAIIRDSSKVGEVTQEVESASRQQNEGIGQVNQAISQFDLVVQNNASSSEETASAAEELQSQVQTLESVVRELYLLVTGKKFTTVAAVRPTATPEVPKGERPAGKQRISFETDEEFVRS